MFPSYRLVISGGGGGQGVPPPLSPSSESHSLQRLISLRPDVHCLSDALCKASMLPSNYTFSHFHVVAPLVWFASLHIPSCGVWKLARCITAPLHSFLSGSRKPQGDNTPSDHRPFPHNTQLSTGWGGKSITKWCDGGVVLVLCGRWCWRGVGEGRLCRSALKEG